MTLGQTQISPVATNNPPAEAVICSDEHVRIISCNQDAETVFGYPQRGMLGQKLEILVPPSDRAAFRQRCQDLLTETGTSAPRMWQYGVGLRQDGSKFTIVSSVSSLIRAADKTLIVIARSCADHLNSEFHGAETQFDACVGERTSQLESAVRRLNAEVEHRRRIERELRDLSSRLLQLQDDERRRIARELHDSTTQILVGVSMHLASLRQRLTMDADMGQQMEECSNLLEQGLVELRTASYLLHPPLLDELGLAPTVRWYAEGFSKRSGIRVSLDLDDGLERMDRDVELALFRVVQETLTNVHRHSRSRSAKIAIQRNGDNVVLKVADQGTGFRAPETPVDIPEARFGVGIAGMRERLRHLQGTLQISTGTTGTTVVASVPLRESAVFRPPDEAVAS